MSEKGASLGEWARWVPLATRRLNNWPDTTGTTNNQRAYGADGLTWFINRLKRTIDGRPVPFQAGQLVWYAADNRKQRPRFNKLGRVWQRAIVLQYIDNAMRRVQTEDGFTTICHVNSLKERKDETDDGTPIIERLQNAGAETEITNQETE